MNPSKARQRLRQLQEELPALLEPFFTRDRLFPGCVYTTQRRCGRPNGRCARGQLRPGTSVSFTENGRPRSYRLTAEQRQPLEPLARHYRRFREARRQVRQRLQELLRLVDGLEERLRVSPSEYLAKVNA